MTRARSATAIIWSTVVSAGAMLGTPACGGGNSAKPVKPTPVTHSDPTPTPPTEPIYVGAPDPIETLDPPVVEAPPEPVVAMVKLTITSTPVGATVFGSDGVERGKTPLILELPSSAEPLTLRVSHDGYGDKEMVVKPEADATFDFALVKNKRIRGSGGGGGKGTGRGFILS